MIRYSLTRPPGGRRYSSTDRRAARMLTAADAASTLTPAAIAAMTDEDGIAVVADVLFELESNRLRRPVTVELLMGAAVVAPASGDVSSLVNGRRVSTAADPAVVFPNGTLRRAVRLTWATARRINVVEIHGDSTVGQVTGATVYTLDAAGVRTFRASASSTGGRLAIPLGPLDQPISCRGVIVELDSRDPNGGSTPGSAGKWSLVEVDPMLILDVSDDVESLSVEWSRETDPGSASSPVGNYEASTVQLTLDDTAGKWNPATNAALDVGHRIEVAFGVERPGGTGGTVEEVLPAGVFYSEPFDTDSDSTTVSINGTDRLGRSADTVVAEDVLVNATVRSIVQRLARNYLDLDVDQVAVADTIGDVVLPYAYPSGNLGSYLADLAKATAGTVHVDALDRLVLARRTDASANPVATIRDDSSLIGFRRPPGYDVTTSIVTVNASPLATDVVSDLWAMPAGGIRVAVGATYLLVATYDNPPAINAFVTGIVADGAYTITAARYYADRAEISIRNDATVQLVVADLRVRGNPLVEATLTARREHAPSVARYGPREITVDARLIQTQAQVETVAAVLLDAFRSLSDDGVRRLPDLSFDSLGLLHLTAGDRVTLVHSTKGLGGDYVILGRRLTYSGGSLLLNDVRVRETPSLLPFLTLDSGQLLDDGRVVGY